MRGYDMPFEYVSLLSDEIRGLCANTSERDLSQTENLALLRDK